MNIETLLTAAEFGFKACERGENLQMMQTKLRSFYRGEPDENPDRNSVPPPTQSDRVLNLHAVIHNLRCGLSVANAASRPYLESVLRDLENL